MSQTFIAEMSQASENNVIAAAGQSSSASETQNCNLLSKHRNTPRSGHGNKVLDITEHISSRDWNSHNIICQIIFVKVAYILLLNSKSLSSKNSLYFYN